MEIRQIRSIADTTWCLLSARIVIAEEYVGQCAAPFSSQSSPPTIAGRCSCSQFTANRTLEEMTRRFGDWPQRLPAPVHAELRETDLLAIIGFSSHLFIGADEYRAISAFPAASWRRKIRSKSFFPVTEQPMRKLLRSPPCSERLSDCPEEPVKQSQTV